MTSSTKLLGERDIPPQKITGYLLDPNHPEGGGKAKFLMAHGFHARQPQLLANAIHAHAELNYIEETVHNNYGTKHIVRCRIPTPDGRNPCIQVIWIREHGCETHRLVTAYPSELKRAPTS
ncbi:DUF6883 domain-containing protein [Sphingomonas prati]|uniref:DUF6883 domain-containing protein n=1 Tax=Sphingomonas prati TaxID=1843237 RepID=UPI0019AD6049|nr:hypothetical protein GCM10011404_04190 [Sphingomonas prati]